MSRLANKVFAIAFKNIIDDCVKHFNSKNGYFAIAQFKTSLNFSYYHDHLCLAAYPHADYIAGCLPLDDAKRHVAKVISGKPWQEIIVLRNVLKVDTNPGWHSILYEVHRLTSWNAKSLVLFSVLFLFLMFTFFPLAFVRRPESWGLALLAAALAYPDIELRLLLGRPFIFTMIYVVFICFQWQKLVDKKLSPAMVAGIIGLSAASTWIHCSWYLQGLPVVAFVMARQWKGALRLAICTAAGVILGALLTGKPIAFITYNVLFASHIFTSLPHDVLVEEFQPLKEWWPAIFMAVMVLFVRRFRGEKNLKLLYNPVIFLIIICYVLSFHVCRFWYDIGLPAFVVWITIEFDKLFVSKLPATSWLRVAATVIVATALYFHFVNDHEGRWKNGGLTWNLAPIVAHCPDWLPDSGGIIYNYDMHLFYDTFFLFPNAPWRYMLGSEPSMMPDEDLRTYADIIKTNCSYASFKPWVEKMTSADRLVLTGHPLRLPKIPELEWRCFGPKLWIGRIPRNLEIVKGIR